MTHQGDKTDKTDKIAAKAVSRTWKMLGAVASIVLTTGGIVAWDLTRNAAQADVDVLSTRVNVVEQHQAADQETFKNLRDDDDKLGQQIQSTHEDLKQDIRDLRDEIDGWRHR